MFIEYGTQKLLCPVVVWEIMEGWKSKRVIGKADILVYMLQRNV